MPHVLVTGFGPWGPHRSNPSWTCWKDAALALPPGWTLARTELPVAWEAGWKTLAAALEAPSELRLVLCCGLAADRTAITPERFAHNLASTTAPDIHGQTHPTEWIEASGPVAYAATVPVPALVAALVAAGLPAAESRDAGTFLCNYVTYRLLHRLAGDAKIRAGFVHLPPDSALTSAQWQALPQILLDAALATPVAPT